MENRRWRKAVGIVLGVVFTAGLVLSSTAIAEAPQPGTESDPLVAKSYVDQQVKTVQSYADSKVQGIQAQVDQIKSGGSNTNTAVEAANTYTDAQVQSAKTQIEGRFQLQVVNLTSGQVLQAEAGAELIVRTGRFTVVGSKMGGLSDVTTGADRIQGELAPENHLLLVPRSDGRGLAALTDSIVMVRGSYSIK